MWRDTLRKQLEFAKLQVDFLSIAVNDETNRSGAAFRMFSPEKVEENTKSGGKHLYDHLGRRDFRQPARKSLILFHPSFSFPPQRLSFDGGNVLSIGRKLSRYSSPPTLFLHQHFQAEVVEKLGSLDGVGVFICLLDRSRLSVKSPVPSGISGSFTSQSENSPRVELSSHRSRTDFGRFV